MSDGLEQTRTIKTIQIELQTVFQQIGFLVHQVEREIPFELDKLHNKTLDLMKELEKKQKQEADNQQKAVDQLKAKAASKEVEL